MSKYFPKNTSYFYGYPAGYDSGFVNKVPPGEEELVSMRPISCAGSDVKVVTYSPMTSPLIDQTLLDAMDVPSIAPEQQIYLPLYITPSLIGAERNEAIKHALTRLTGDRSLVMAQPYSSQRLEPKYQISQSLSAALNDKHYMQQLIPTLYRPKAFAHFADGAEFAEAAALELPCVIKASRSRSGDGVYICKAERDIAKAKTELADLTDSIIVEQYIEVEKNYALQFAIPHDRSRPIDILGHNEQLTDQEGSFLGGVIRSTQLPPELLHASQVLRHDILPKVRATGWYGVGGFDVLIDTLGRFYFIDGNFRMTGMTSYHFLAANQQLQPPFLTFSGSFAGSRQDFEEQVLPLACRGYSDKIIQIIALSEHNNTWRFNGALLFKDHVELKQRCLLLERSGITSGTLHSLLHDPGSFL